MKKKYKRGSPMPFVTKGLFKGIMKGSKLRNSYLKNKTDANWILYKTKICPRESREQE